MSTAEEEFARLRVDAQSILAASLKDCSVEAAFARTLRCDGMTLHRLRASSGEKTLNLAEYAQVQIVALGKAAVPMIDALLAMLPDELKLCGVCAAPALPTQPHPKIRYFASGHPLPNAESFAAAHAALKMLSTADASTLVLFLISGGGSALCELPLDSTIALEETREFHRALIGCGAPISAMNAIRQQFSAVKGGRLAAAAGAATQLSLLVSDVPADALDALASGPTLPSRTTAAEVTDLLERYDLPERFPPAVQRYFALRSERHGGMTQGLPRNARRYFDQMLSADDLTEAAAHHAASLGYRVVVDHGCDDMEAEAAAEFLWRRFDALQSESPRVCLISVGEVTVRLGASPGTGPGTGGRNQHFALETARLLERANSRVQPVVALSAGSDGIDGNSPAAGAVVDARTMARARQLGFDPETALREHNAWPLFHALGDAIVTGPTGNNLRDLRLMLTA